MLAQQQCRSTQQPPPPPPPPSAPDPPPLKPPIAGQRQKAYRIRSFRVALRSSLIACILHSRLQKLGKVEKAIWGKTFSHRVGMHG
jgi:hypothetical protein